MIAFFASASFSSFWKSFSPSDINLLGDVWTLLAISRHRVRKLETRYSLTRTRSGEYGDVHSGASFEPVIVCEANSMSPVLSRMHIVRP